MHSPTHEAHDAPAIVARKRSKCLHWIRHAIGATFFLLPLIVTLLLRTAGEQSFLKVADEDFVRALNYIGDGSFAVTGALAAGLQGMDFLGCVVVGFTTALGGGTFRDLMLGRTPVFWLTAWDEALLCVCLSATTFWLWPLCERQLRLSTDDDWLFWTDTLGLGVFAANGAYIGFTHTPRVHFGAAAACGMFTATFGGATRDVLLRLPVRILHSHAEIYAIPALAGGLATTTWLQLAPSGVKEALLLGIWVTVLARVLALNHGLRLPTYAHVRRGAASTGGCGGSGARLEAAAADPCSCTHAAEEPRSLTRTAAGAPLLARLNSHTLPSADRR